MSASKILLLVLGGFVALIGGVILVCVLAYSTAYDTGNRLENSVIAQYDKNKVSLSNLSNSVMEAIQIPDIQKTNLKEVIEASMQGRYGSDGSRAVVQAITENYPGTVDPALYTKVQNMIESGRNNFAAEQNVLVAKVQVYKTSLDSLWLGFWMRIAGYPKINLADYRIIQSDYAAEAFRTGIDKGLKLGK